MTWMDGPWGYYATGNNSDGERQVQYDFTHMWNIKQNKINEQTKSNKNKHTDQYGEQSSGYQRGKGVEGGWNAYKVSTV